MSAEPAADVLLQGQSDRRTVRSRSARPGFFTHAAAFSIAGIAALPYGRSFFEFSTGAYVVMVGVLLGSGLILATRRRSLDGGLMVYAQLVLLLGGWLLFSASWSISPQQVESDVVQILGLMAVCVGILLAGGRMLPATVASYTVLTGIAITFHVLSQYVAAGNLRGYDVDLKDAYLVAGSILGASATLALTTGMLAERPRARFGWYLASVVLLIGVALSLARGALLFSLLVSFAAAGYAILGPHKGLRIGPGYVRIRRGALAGAVAVTLVVVATITAALQVERTASRLERLFSDRELVASERVHLWSTSLESINRAPLSGYGLGSNGIMSGAGDDYYPHNILLQVWLDGGLPALLALIAVLSLPVVYVVGRPFPRSNYRWLPFVAAYVFCVLEYMKSSDTYTGRLIVIFAALSIIAARKPVTEQHCR